MSERYAILVDGTAALPAEVARELGIRVIPMHVSFGAETFTEGVDITPAQFYERLSQPGARATTSQPSNGEFADFYRQLIADGNRSILVLTIATELSGCYSVASTTAREIQSELGARIEILDSRSLKGALGLVATACARARRDGASFDEALALARRLIGHVTLFAVIDTLEHLRRSGRASSLQALFGSLLSVKPILEVKEGRLEAIEKVRTRDRAFARLKELVESRVAPGSAVHFTAYHTNAPERARELGAWARERFECVEYYEGEAGPVIAAHAGPGVLCATFYPDALLGGR